jgi:4,5-dihydroxyphthalate decarboxylase
MHLVAVRRALYEQNPFMATSLYKAFTQSKDLALSRMRHGGMLQTMMPWMLAQIEEMDKVFGPDPWPYGVDANRKTLDALMLYLVQQSLIAKPIPVDDLFVPVFREK